MHTFQVIRALVALTISLASLAAVAQAYPQRPVRLIVPFAAGGTTDGLGRVLAQYLGERLGQSVVVENRPGGGGTLGAEAGARATPDGYTALLGSVEAFGMTNADAKRLNYNPEKDLLPVAMVTRAPNVFIVNAAVKASSLKELIGLARANPGKIRYGSPGIGSNPHLIGEIFAVRAGIKLEHVPYKGGGAGIGDLVSGQIEMMITGVVTSAGQIKAGKARALAMTGSQRAVGMPDVPMMAEVGFNDFVLGALFGVFLPTNSPQDAATRLTQEVLVVKQNPEFRKRIADIGQELAEDLTGAAFGRYMVNEAKRWREMAVAAGLRDQ